jgi:single-strand DNA-binding protein
LATRSWDDKDGNKRYTTEVQANQIQLLGSRSDAAVPQDVQEPPDTDQQVPEPDASETDDLPF